MAGIYIHVPFCKQACTYCDFYFSTNLRSKEAYVKSLLSEIEIRQNYLETKKIDSIYFGGGTPSLLSDKDLESIFLKLNEFYSWDKLSEITLEVNPDDVKLENLKNWQKNGINRLSIGLQSFDNNELAWMNRTHTAEQSIGSVKLAQDVGFGNLSIDLIYGSKFQTKKSWEQTLETAVELNTQHVSAYNLTIESKTKLGTHFNRGLEPAIDEELSSIQFEKMSRYLTNGGFIHYEISNFGKEGFVAKHNTSYWQQKKYLGLGPSAHSFNGQSRQWNINNIHSYNKAIENQSSFFEIETLGVKEKFNEYVLTRLRTIWGCDAKKIKEEFGEDIYEHFIKSVSRQKQHFLVQESHYILNNNGRLRADGIAASLFLE
jgi:oxygen-independent coproporphyrinogen III oxidase